MAQTKKQRGNLDRLMKEFLGDEEDIDQETKKWDSYGSWILRNRLAYIKNQHPKIYIINDVTCGEYSTTELEEFRKKGLKVTLEDNKTLIKELEKSIYQLERKK